MQGELLNKASCSDRLFEGCAYEKRPEVVAEELRK